MNKKPLISEHDAQCVVVSWCRAHEARYPNLRWLHSSVNGAKLPYRKNRYGQRYSPEAMRLKAEGLKPGVSDLFLPVPMNGYCGLWIEMKVGSNQPTEEQVEFTKGMNLLGYLAVTCWGSDQAITVIAEYMGIPEGEWW